MLGRDRRGARGSWCTECCRNSDVEGGIEASPEALTPCTACSHRWHGTCNAAKQPSYLKCRAVVQRLPARSDLVRRLPSKHPFVAMILSSGSSCSNKAPQVQVLLLQDPLQVPSPPHFTLPPKVALQSPSLILCIETWRFLFEKKKPGILLFWHI